VLQADSRSSRPEHPPAAQSSAAAESGPVVTREDLPLERVYRWERERASELYLVQPLGGGRIRELTWAEAVGEARRIAAWLRGLGFPPGSRMGLVTKNCAHFFIFDLAVWMAGHVSVAIYPTVNADTLRYVLEHSEAKLLFVGKLDAWEGMKSGVPSGVTLLRCALSPKIDAASWEEIVSETPPIDGAPTRGPDETALIMYTSGSTGVPKGVEISFRAAVTPAIGLVTIFGASKNDRLFSYLPLAHTMERATVEALSFWTGCCVHFAESLQTFQDDLRRARPTVFGSVPRLWLKFRDGVNAQIPQAKLERLLRIPIVSSIVRRKILARLGLDATRLAVTGSAPMPGELIDWYRALGLELVEGYGMSENFAYCTMNRIGRGRVGWVGEPCPGVALRTAADGELQVKSPSMMKGYFKDPDLTRASFTSDGWLCTGDRGELDARGRLRITGRVKELFKSSKGKYIAPAPIENLLNATGVVEQSCVMGSGESQPYAVVVLAESFRVRAREREGRSEVERALRELLASINAGLEPHTRLDFLLVASGDWTIESGLLTPTLKIKRQALEARYQDGAARWRRASEAESIAWE
jgi:long-chain acyl-CoA synthetase